jgi:cytidine deaminase
VRRAGSKPGLRGWRAELVQAALSARERAHAPYSGYAVGAALRTRKGRFFTGCNVENSSYGLSLCAERVAAVKAVSEGETEFAAIAIVTRSSPPGPPCGACRQFLEEFSPRMEVILANLEGEVEIATLADLLPHPFDRSFL